MATSDLECTAEVAVEQLSVGDRIVALVIGGDRVALVDAITVTGIDGVIDNGAESGTLRFRAPHDGLSSFDRYLSVDQRVLVARSDSAQQPDRVAAAPTSPSTRRTMRRTIDGIQWRRDASSGHWRAANGRYVISYDDDFITECSEPHPVRIAQARQDEVLGAVTLLGRDGARRVQHLPGGEPNPAYAITGMELAAILERRRGWFCPGNTEHTYALWVGASADDAGIVIVRAGTFTEAARKVAAYDRGEATPEG